ncbi:MAG: hypothetical protein H7249_10655 [Chitinophagaceae bacterium]|nr:hypothetical protein [Oligoflexus sp.]
MENLGAIAAACVYFGLDIRILASKDSNALEALSSDNNGLWAEMDRIVEATAPNFASYINAYLRWVYVKTEEKYWEAGSRPPVGRYTPGARNRRPFSGSSGSSGPRRSGPSGGGRPSGDRDRGPRRDAGDKDRDRGPRPQGGGGRDAAAPGSSSGSSEGRSRRPSSGGPRGGRDNGPRPESITSHADQEQAALESVQRAISHLKADANLSEIRLDPSNSFFRRLQHKKAVLEGFFSFSTGEGNGRSVVVTRDQPANEDAE